MLPGGLDHREHIEVWAVIEVMTLWPGGVLQEHLQAAPLQQAHHLQGESRPGTPLPANTLVQSLPASTASTLARDTFLPRIFTTESRLPAGGGLAIMLFLQTF